MSTIADLPPSTRLLIGPSGQTNYAQDASGSKMRLTWEVTWEDSPAFLQALHGTPEVIGGVTRSIPLQNHFIPSLYAEAISGAKFYGADSAISLTRPYTKVAYTVEYGQPSWDPSSDSPFVTLTHQGSSRSVTVPGQQYAISSGTYSGQKIQQDIGLPIGGVAIGVTLHQLPDLSAFLSVVMPLEGKVNSVAMIVAGVTYPAGTIYFETFSSQSSKTALGTAQHEAGLSLVHSALKWNQVIDPGGSPADITPAPFGVADLNALIM